jgi:peptide methionine sulfoxide reductase MsrA
VFVFKLSTQYHTVKNRATSHSESVHIEHEPQNK